jgi:ubiquinone/menaquinone biosynthesis C-methylase UbiE
MRLNIFEKALINNPIRALIFRHFEAQRLLKMGGKTQGGLALEIGCGQGLGCEVILDAFKADQVHAFDLDPAMIEGARRRVEARGDRINLLLGDVTDIPAANNSYDTAFDFGMIHHVINWRDALKEVHRVLKPGGRFYIEEILAKYIVHPVFRRLLDHPQNDRFDQGEFADALELYAWFVADKPK